MSQDLRQSTIIKVVIGPVVAVADGFTPVTTLNLSTADEAEIIKHDAAGVTDISAFTFAAIPNADGYYNLTITAAASDTLGMLTVLINDDSLCLPIKHEFMVKTANAWDSFHAADKLQVDMEQVGGADATAIAELPQGIPPKNPSFLEAEMFLYMRRRNLQQATATEEAVHNDAGVKIAKAVLSDDDVTTAKAKFTSGA